MSSRHEFQKDRPGMRLPSTLYGGPPPYAGRADGGENARGVPQTAENTLGEPWATLLRGIQRKANLLPQYGTVGTTPILVRPAEDRLYLIVQNTSLAAQVYVGVGYPPSSVTGILLAANGGAYEPYVIPQQEIWILASAADTPFVILYANG